MSEKIMAQLVNLTEGQTALNSKLQSQEKATKAFDDRLNSLASKIGREGGTRGGARSGAGSECIACGKTGHQMAPSAQCTLPSRRHRSRPRTTNDCTRWP